jgi:hypothetical protein
MPMPWQLARGLRERKRSGRTTPRPIAEQLPFVSINHLKVPRDYQTHIAPNISLRYPLLSNMKIAWNMVSFQHRSLHRKVPGDIQTFGIKQIRTGLGGYFRHSFICQCGRPTLRLYIQHQRLACRRCHNAIYASQSCNKRTRAALQVSRLTSFIDNKPRLFRRTRERLRKRLGDKVMLAQGKFGTDAKGLLD